MKRTGLAMNRHNIREKKDLLAASAKNDLPTNAIRILTKRIAHQKIFYVSFIVKIYYIIRFLLFSFSLFSAQEVKDVTSKVEDTKVDESEQLKSDHGFRRSTSKGRSSHHLSRSRLSRHRTRTRSRSRRYRSRSRLSRHRSRSRLSRHCSHTRSRSRRSSNEAKFKSEDRDAKIESTSKAKIDASKSKLLDDVLKKEQATPVQDSADSPTAEDKLSDSSIKTIKSNPVQILTNAQSTKTVQQIADITKHRKADDPETSANVTNAKKENTTPKEDRTVTLLDRMDNCVSILSDTLEKFRKLING